MEGQKLIEKIKSGEWKHVRNQKRREIVDEGGLSTQGEIINF